VKDLTPLKAIRLKCLDCCAGSIREVKRCHITDCYLHQYRFGRNPKRAGIGPRKAEFRDRSVVELGVGGEQPSGSLAG
jgi:hypothetical protein